MSIEQLVVKIKKGMLCSLCNLKGTSIAFTYFINPACTAISRSFQDKCPNKQIIKQMIAIDKIWNVH